jgi:Leucine-rich repeat (LRR) protein
MASAAPTTLQRPARLPTDLLQLVVEYVPTVREVLACRGVSTRWASAVSDAVGYLHGRCWTALEFRERASEENLFLAHWATGRRRDERIPFAILALRNRLETLALFGSALRLGMLAEDDCNDTLVSLHLRKVDLRIVSLGRDMPCTAGSPPSEVVTRIPRFERLAELTCDQCHFGANALRLLRSPALIKLELHFISTYSAVDSVGALLRGSPNLRHLSLSGPTVGDGDIVGLETIPRLEVLILNYSNVTDMRSLCACPSLQRLEVNYSQVNDKGIQHLGTLPALVTLRMSCRTLRDVTRLTSQPTRIEHLALAHLPLRGDPSWWERNFQSLRKRALRKDTEWWARSFPALQKLELTRSTVDDHLLSAVALLPALTVLILRSCSMGTYRTGNFELLQNALQLREVDIGGSEFGSLDGLERIPHLEKLNLRRCPVLNMSILGNCQALQCLALDFTVVTDIDLIVLERIPALATLSLIGCRHVLSLKPLLCYPALKALTIDSRDFDASEVAAAQQAVSVIDWSA